MSQDADQAPQSTPEAPGATDPLATIHDLGAVPTGEHVPRFEAVERALRARIDDADAPGSAAGAR